MRFSVLLPTRNGLEFLRYAIQSVLCQDYSNWELIISDNYSTDSTAEYVAQLNDQRIKYRRTEAFLPVTENWNRCLQRAEGEYFVMLGDDDALLPGYFRSATRVLEEYGRPDLLFSDAYLFAYPGVHPRYPQGYLQAGSIQYFRSRKPFLLDERTAKEIVKRSMSFRYCIPFNMQYSLLSRELVNDLSARGPFFDSIFPDYFATVAEFLVAKRILVWRRPLAVIGITPKSHGYFSLNQRVDEAKQILHGGAVENELEPLKEVILSGDWLLVGWLSAMHRLSLRYPHRLLEIGADIDYQRYRWLQIVYNYRRRYFTRDMASTDFNAFQRFLSPRERIFRDLTLRILFSAMSGGLRLRNHRTILRLWRLFRRPPRILVTGGYTTIQDVVDAMSGRLESQEPHPRRSR